MKTLVLLPVCAAAFAFASDQFDPSSYAAHNVISRDVAVIGGDSTGIYGAMNLRALEKSVVVIEKEEILGGHTRTWTDPKNGISINYGLQAYGSSKYLTIVTSS